jgi:3-phenylpropionate/trans-cinnamate dioxygenase ferredoxin subunit
MSKWVTIANDAELLEGDRKAITVENTPILLIKTNGTYYAVHNLCTHESLPLTEGTLEGTTLSCPFHGASFCIKTGGVKTPPAFADLETYPTRIEQQSVQVFL